MLLAIDAGNTNIKFALVEGREIRTRWRIATDARRTADQYAVWLIQLMAIEGYSRDDVSAVIISTVVVITQGTSASTQYIERVAALAPAVMGVLAVAAVWLLGTLAFDRRAGLLAGLATWWITHADTLQVQLQPRGRGQGSDSGDDGTEGSTSPWFDLSLGMEINGQRHNILPLLPELIAAAANSPINAETGLPEMPPYVYLPNQQAGHGGFIRLPTDALKPWMAALLELVGDRAHDFSGGSCFGGFVVVNTACTTYWVGYVVGAH